MQPETWPRSLPGRTAGGPADAQRAIDVYIHRLASGIASMSAATGGVDVLAFTGGVGERSAMAR
jgi:acetate kinase